MFNRQILTNLRQWVKSENRKPLVLRGARQVGKTTAAELFSREFDSFLYVNLERPGETGFFNRNLPVRELFQAIALSKNIPAPQGRCLLFIDEIQNSPEAVAYLRYFYEEMKDLFVIAAGSLLESMMSKGAISFPVGRIEFLRMYPLTFSEYLEAMNLEQLSSAFSVVPLPQYAGEALLKEFHTYALIGGMPEAIAAYTKNHSVIECNRIYQNLMTSFLDDIPKYARNHSLALIMRHCIENVPFEAGKRIAFARFGKSEYRSREAGEALKTLERAMLIYLLQPSTSTEQPIIPDLKKATRLQFIDTGLLNFCAGLQQQYFNMENLQAIYRGLLAEHIVGQELIATSEDATKLPHFWVRESPQSNAEVDFLYLYRNTVVPIEVKAGSVGTLRSLHQFMQHSKHDMAVRLYSGKIDLQECETPDRKKFRLLNLPYFLASQVEKYLEWASTQVIG